MHAKTDSEVTSLAPFSPARSPPRAATNNTDAGTGRGVIRGTVYYVQSSSRDSHDGETTIKGATSVHSTPALSPMVLPRHSQSPVGRDSSSSLFSHGHAHHKEEGQVGPILLGGGHGPSGDDFRQMVRSMTGEPYCRLIH